MRKVPIALGAAASLLALGLSAGRLRLPLTAVPM